MTVMTDSDRPVAPATAANGGAILGTMRRRLVSLVWLRYGVLFLAVIGFAALALVFADAALILTPQIRATLPWLILGGAVLVIAVGIWNSARGRELWLARRLESHDPALGNALTNAVQLAGALISSAVGETLRRRAVEEGREQSRSIRVWPLLRRGVLASLIAIFAAGLLWTITGIGAPELFRIAVLRFLDPFGDHPPFSRLSIVVQPQNVHVLFGEDCEIRATASGRPVEKLYLVSETETEATRTVMFRAPNGSYFQTLSDVRHSAAYYITDGRARTHRYRINVRMTPRIAGVRIHAVFPDHTQMSPQSHTLGVGPAWAGTSERGPGGTKPAHSNLRLPRDTAVTFYVACNRPFASGKLTLTPFLGGAARVIELTAKIGNSTTVSGDFRLTDAVAYSVSLTDPDGLKSRDRVDGRIGVLADRRPRLTVIKPRQETVSTPEVRVPVHVQVEDDYGVSELSWFRGVNKSIEREKPMVLQYENDRRQAVAVTTVDLADLGVQSGDVIEYYFRAADNDPYGPNVVTSPIFSIRIISEEEYQDVLRRTLAQSQLFAEYESLTEGLRELSARTESINSEWRQGAKTGAEATKQNAKQKHEAESLARAMRNQQTAMEDLTQQPDAFDVESDLKQQLQEMARQLNDLREKLEQLTSGDQEMTADDFEPIAKEMNELMKKMDAGVGKPARQMAAVAKLMSRAKQFVDLAAQQSEIVQLARPLAESFKELAAVEEMELRELSNRERDVERAVDEMILELPGLIADVPNQPQYTPLHHTAMSFIFAVREDEIIDDLAEAAGGFESLVAAKGMPPAESAAEKMDALISRCDKMGKSCEQCLLTFNPSFKKSMSNSLAQLLLALTGSTAEAGEDGYSLFSSAAAVYGPGPPLIGGRLFNTGDDNPNASGPRFRSDAGQAVDLRAAKGHGSTRVKLQRDAKFPLRYRNLVGDYFKIIAESLEEER